MSTRPFEGVDARLSRYSYLVSLLPQKIVRELGLDFAVRKRTVSSYTPTVRGGRATGLLVGGDAHPGVLRRAHRRRPGVRGLAALLRDDGPRRRAGVPDAHRAPAGPRGAAGPCRRRGCLARCCSRSPIGVAVEESFADDLVRGVVLTDALIGTFADAHDPSLLQNRCFLYHVIGDGTGDWDVPVGGMGALTDALAGAARAAGAEIRAGCTRRPVSRPTAPAPRSPSATPTGNMPSARAGPGQRVAAGARRAPRRGAARPAPRAPS